MNTVDGILLLLFAGLLAVLWLRSRRRKKEVLDLGYSVFATVTEYRSEFVRVAGSWTTLDYPYVAYQDSEGAWRTERLKHATSGNREFFVNHRTYAVEIPKPAFQAGKRVFKLLKQRLLLRQHFDYQQTVF